VTSDVRHAEFYRVRTHAGIHSLRLLTQSARFLQQWDEVYSRCHPKTAFERPSDKREGQRC
jgi:hypothetical protein